MSEIITPVYLLCLQEGSLGGAEIAWFVQTLKKIFEKKIVSISVQICLLVLSEVIESAEK